MTDFNELKIKALQVQELYNTLNSLKGEQKWDYKDYADGMVGDIGDLMKLLMAKKGLRGSGVVDTDEAIKHELCDVLWSVIVIANELNIDLAKEFDPQMKALSVGVQKAIDKKRNQ